ncbi:MAG: LL-diaminopimelate aminotransferase [Deltaproteobacteria bacterium]|nr:LL-diaminopimelate aminotransferase [Deltaproteobacteria bacterium]
MQLATRLQQLPPYVFAELDRKKGALQAAGMDLIDLSIGDPDQPTPPPILAALARGAADRTNHRYPPYAGTRNFREAACGWMERHYAVTLDPDRECLALIGSKEGIAHLPWAFVNPGEVVLVPSPGYPVYTSGALFVGATPHLLPLRADRGFLPDLAAIPAEVARKAKLLWINYPNNPTAAVATREFFAEAILFAKRHNLILAHDTAYAEIFYDGERPVSLLQCPGGMDVGIEFHSLSKTFNMTGWRIGFAVGNPAIVQGLAKMKTNLDSGVFGAVQTAGIAALTAPELVQPIRASYQRRRDCLVAGLSRIGWPVTAPKATFYVWAQVPNRMSSAEFATLLLERAGVVITPGTGFGAEGEGYVRFALTATKERISEAIDRLRELL